MDNAPDALLDRNVLTQVRPQSHVACTRNIRLKTAKLHAWHVLLDTSAQPLPLHLYNVQLVAILQKVQASANSVW